MRITWDAALVATTARALDRRFTGDRIRGIHLDPDRRRVALYLRDATLVWELHPTRLGFRILEAADPPPEAIPHPARLHRVWSPRDDRILVLETRRVRGRPPVAGVVLELLPNQENGLFTEGPDRTIRSLLRTREGDRPLRRGRPYAFPAPSDRVGQDEDPGPDWWARTLAPGTPRERRRALLSGVAWTSPVVASELLADDGYTLWRRLREVATGADVPAGAVLAGRHGPQPYPISLTDRTLAEHDHLLDAFEDAARRGEDPAGGVEALIPGHLAEALDAEVDRARARVARLEEELAGQRDPDELQGWGDLLLARFRLVPEGQDQVTLEGFDGTAVRIPLDPALSPDANARRHYDRAARVRRAQEELPGRIREARREWEGLGDLRDRLRAGEAARDEVEAVLPDPGGGSGGGDRSPALPYRRFRSSGGFEIRVGRGAARNDQLTFHHTRPDEIWLHARHTAGAHVILRWSGDGSPPPRDLYEAGVLAALHSRARTSGSVPVDWTRRKYVRKPRKAPPGAVLPERAQTVFVKPDPALLERLRED